MILAKDLRRALATEIRDLVANQWSPALPVDEMEAFPEYTPEDLQNGPRIPVFLSSRSWGSMQGPDNRLVGVSCGVAGYPQRPPGFVDNFENRLKHFRDATDRFDLVIERLARLWTNTSEEPGPLFNKQLAGFDFQTLDQPAFVDDDIYRQNGVWVSIIEATYRDLED